MLSSAKALTQRVKTEARRLGFHLVGVTTPDPPPHFDVYTHWIAAGYQGKMDYLATERALQRRQNPCSILPECRSILVLGIRYPAPRFSQPAKISGLQGQVAAYAWGRDYHQVLPRRLRALVTFIENEVGAPIPNRVYTDTGPLMERDLAQRAGLGWIGKNTCLIHPNYGSYLFLAEVLLGIELQPEAPFEHDRCGSCTRCVEACPTQCLLPQRVLDARRCISYLTIEHWGIIPPELRPLISNWVFGCDVCQQVCPWNQRFANPEGDPAFAHRPGIPHPVLTAELGLTPEEFQHKFRGSPIKRSKRRGYLRNIAVALGNAANPSALPSLIRALQDEEPLVRGHAAWALGRLNMPQAQQVLGAALLKEDHPQVRTEIQAAIADL